MVRTFDQLIGNVKDEAVMWTLKPVEIFIQLFPTEAPQYLNSLLGKIVLTIIFDSQVLAVHEFTLSAK